MRWHPARWAGHRGTFCAPTPHQCTRKVFSILLQAGFTKFPSIYFRKWNVWRHDCRKHSTDILRKGRNVLSCSHPLWTCNLKKHPLICIKVCTLAAAVFFLFLDLIGSWWKQLCWISANCSFQKRLLQCLSLIWGLSSRCCCCRNANIRAAVSSLDDYKYPRWLTCRSNNQFAEKSI